MSYTLKKHGSQTTRDFAQNSTFQRIRETTQEICGTSLDKRQCKYI